MTSKIDVPAEIRLKYIERRQKDVQDCRQALAAEDYDVLTRVGHQLKGNATTFGYNELADIAADIEEAALKKDQARLGELLLRFTTYVEKMQ